MMRKKKLDLFKDPFLSYQYFREMLSEPDKIDFAEAIFYLLQQRQRLQIRVLPGRCATDKHSIITPVTYSTPRSLLHSLSTLIQLPSFQHSLFIDIIRHINP